MDYTIKYATQDEIDQVVELRHRAFQASAPNHYSELEVQNLLQDVDMDELNAMSRDQKLFCYWQNGQMIGTAGWKSDRLRHLYVQPNQSKKGIGRQLLEYALKDFQKRTTYQSILAGVIIYARPFYEKCGFSLVSEEIAWDGSRYYLMKRSLSR